jgi:hypothetical protein
MEVLLEDGTNITREVMEELQHGRLMQQVQAEKNQKLIAQANHRLGDRRNLNFGRLRLQVDEEVYHYWGQRLGYMCWKDKEWLNWFEKNNESARVKSRSTNASVIKPHEYRYLIKK